MILYGIREDDFIDVIARKKTKTTFKTAEKEHSCCDFGRIKKKKKGYG